MEGVLFEWALLDLNSKSVSFFKLQVILQIEDFNGRSTFSMEKVDHSCNEKLIKTMETLCPAIDSQVRSAYNVTERSETGMLDTLKRMSTDPKIKR